MKVLVSYRGGPEWDTSQYSSIVYHHLAHGVSEEFMKTSLEWVFKTPGLLGATTTKPTDLESDINWITTLEFTDAPDSLIAGKIATREVIADHIIDKFNSIIIPELSKVGYSIEITTEHDQ